MGLGSAVGYCVGLGIESLLVWMLDWTVTILFAP
jgi:hypothetical protein